MLNASIGWQGPLDKLRRGLITHFWAKLSVFDGKWLFVSSLLNYQAPHCNGAYLNWSIWLSQQVQSASKTQISHLLWPEKEESSPLGWHVEALEILSRTWHLLALALESFRGCHLSPLAPVTKILTHLRREHDLQCRCCTPDLDFFTIFFTLNKICNFTLLKTPFRDILHASVTKQAPRDARPRALLRLLQEFTKLAQRQDSLQQQVEAKQAEA